MFPGFQLSQDISFIQPAVLKSAWKASSMLQWEARLISNTAPVPWFSDYVLIVVPEPFKGGSSKQTHSVSGTVVAQGVEHVILLWPLPFLYTQWGYPLQRCSDGEGS